MAGQVKSAKAPKGGGGSGRTIVTVLLLLPVVAVLLPTCVVLVIHMAPTAVAYMTDRTRQKYLAISVGLLNFCGTLPAEFELWSHGQTYQVARDVATDPLNWLLAYGAAAIGWGIYLALPLGIANYYGMMTSNRIQAMRRRQQDLVAAWGEEVEVDPDKAEPKARTRAR